MGLICVHFFFTESVFISLPVRYVGITLCGKGIFDFRGSRNQRCLSAAINHDFAERIREGEFYFPQLSDYSKWNRLCLRSQLYDEKAPFRVEVSANDEDKFMIKSINGVGGLPSWGYPETR